MTQTPPSEEVSQEKEMTIVIRPELKRMCNKDVCRAALFNHILYWIARKHVKYGEPYWYATGEQLYKQSCETWGITKIRHETNELIKNNFIGATTNPAWGSDRTKYFFFEEEQARAFFEACAKEDICPLCISFSDEVEILITTHLMILSNANDETIKCICQKCQLHLMKLSKPFDKSDRAITKETTKGTYKGISNSIPEEESNGESAERTTYASALSLDASLTLDDAESQSDSPRLQESMDGLAYSPSATGMTTRNEALIALLHEFRSGDEQEQQENLRVLQEAGIVPFETSQGEPPHASTIPGSTHRDTSRLSSGALPGVSRVDDSTTPDTTLEVAHEDILQVLRPSGLPDDNDAHGTNGHHPLDSLGAGDALAVVRAEEGNVGGRSEVGVGAVGATGEGRATDGRLDEKGDNDDTTTHVPADRDTLLLPGDADRDARRQLAEQAITQQTSSFPPTVEPGHGGWDTMPGAPVPVVPSHDRGTTLSTHSPVSPLTTSTVVQAGALPASSFPLSPTNGQGTTFSGTDDEATQQGDVKPEKPKKPRQPKEAKPEPTADEIALQERCRRLYNRIVEWRGYAFDLKGAIINERTYVKRLAMKYESDELIEQIYVHLTTKDFKWSKPSFRFKVGAYELFTEAPSVIQQMKISGANHKDEDMVEWNGRQMTKEEATKEGYLDLGGWERYKGQVLPDGRNALEELYDDAVARGLM